MTAPLPNKDLPPPPAQRGVTVSVFNMPRAGAALAAVDSPLATVRLNGRF